MRKRLIVLIDFSAYSADLLRYAYDWSRWVSAGLVLVHQTSVMTPVFTDTKSKAAIKQTAQEEALEKLKKLTKNTLPPRTEVQYAVSGTSLLLTLPKLLAEPFEQLVIMGLKGTGTLKKIFIGSTVVQVIEQISGVAVAIPKNISAFASGKLYIAVSGKYPLNMLALNHFLHFIKEETDRITFFYLGKPGEETAPIEKQLKELTDLFGAKYNTCYEIYEGSRAFEDIKRVINDKTEELLIIQKGSRMLTDQLFRRFLVNELVYEGQTPLVVLP